MGKYGLLREICMYGDMLCIFYAKDVLSGAHEGPESLFRVSTNNAQAKPLVR